MRHDNGTRIAILGSTGTIGDNTLDVVMRHADRMRVVALGARSNWRKLLAQIERHRPEVAALADAEASAVLAAEVTRRGLATRVLSGEAALVEMATAPNIDTVMAAIVGAAGLPSTLAAARAGKRLLLANKESLVMAGPLLMQAVRASGATLLPIDSEHNAVFQCLPYGTVAGELPRGVRRILLTASGGPFIDWSIERLASATPAQACAHPNWVMGRKISVDSATLLNKGLELIEACLLFGVAPEQVEVVVHRESIIHSMVEYVDGSVLAQLGSPDMRTPIAHALAWPDRVASGVQFLDLVRVARLRFEAPDFKRFPGLALAQRAARVGGTMPAILNAANEVAVAAFLDGRLNFDRIAPVIEAVMTRIQGGSAATLEEIMAADTDARRIAAEIVAREGSAFGALEVDPRERVS